jgi:hypothetical protein
MTGASAFSAADSALGYLYQVRVARLWALRRLKSDNEFLVSLETLDDVAFESTGGTPEELLQTKHHRNKTANLADASPDLWKTLRVWLETGAHRHVEQGAVLHLLTAGTAASGSIASKLRIANRDVEGALAALQTVAESSTNKDNAPAYAAFLQTPFAERKKLLEAVFIADSASDVMSLENELRAEVFWAADRKHHVAFLENLEGWWFRRCLKQLASMRREDRIVGGEIEAQMTDIREQFKQDSLPIDDDLLALDLDEATQDAQANSQFVRQLEIIMAGKRRIVAAIRDYYRAFEQRSRWLRNELLLVGDLTRYEKRLVEEWELVFEGMKDDLGEGAAEAAKQQAARKVLQWAETASLPIRPNVTEPFVTRGSLHMLADEARVGWHPEFQIRLTALLQPAEASK